jgi:hypothetical protein
MSMPNANNVGICKYDMYGLAISYKGLKIDEYLHRLYLSIFAVYPGPFHKPLSQNFTIALKPPYT